MDRYEPVDSFDESNASEYDELAVRGDEETAVAFLAARSGGGPVLELAIGTGRIALPLAAATGARVDGIDISQPMVDRLRAKLGGAELSVSIGDFVHTPLGGPFRLVYVVFNSFFNVLTQDDQVQAFENVAANLTDDGVFVIEALLPNALPTTDHQYVQVEAIGVDEVRLDLLRDDPSTQTIEENHVTISATGIRFNPVVQRYAWPAELDLMARIAGLRLHERWGGWSGELFTKHSTLAVSVWGR